MESLLANLTSPPLMFFGLGLLAAAVRSDLEIPEQVARLLSLYLLFAIGIKGGTALATNDLDFQTFAVLGAAVLLSCAIPLIVFGLTCRQLGAADAAAVAATYGSVSAVTFVAATSFLDSEGVTWSGYLVAAMALMESPAIIVGLLLYRLVGSRTDVEINAKEMLHESFLNGSVLLILGSLVIGYVSGPQGIAQLDPMVGGLFTGVLCLFLLDMGIVAMRRIRDLGARSATVRPPLLIVLGLFLPLLHALAGLVVSALLGLSEGDALLLTVLAASASYIAVPAAMRLALPEANPSIYLGMSLAVTFPFNLIVGIPLYLSVVRWLL